MTKKEQKLLEARVNRITSKSCVDSQVPVMKLSEIFNAGLKAARDGGTDEQIFDACKAVVDRVKL